MLKVEFHAEAPVDIDLTCVVIVARHGGKWLFVRHNERTTYEIPGGHIEPGEDYRAAAKRELYEETGAKEFTLDFISVYTITADEKISGGYLFFADIKELTELPDYEMAEVVLEDSLPDNLTYPLIQPYLFKKVVEWISTTKSEIRPMTVEHLPQYADVIRRSFATVAQEFGWTRENAPGHVSFRTDAQLANKQENGYFPFGYFVGDTIIGFVSLTDMGNGSYELNKLSVLPLWRHYGYGKKLLDFCKTKVGELGGSKIKLDIIEENIMLKNWYAANGFIHTGTKIFEHLPFTVGYMEWSV